MLQFFPSDEQGRAISLPSIVFKSSSGRFRRVHTCSGVAYSIYCSVKSFVQFDQVGPTTPPEAVQKFAVIVVFGAHLAKSHDGFPTFTPVLVDLYIGYMRMLRLEAPGHGRKTRFGSLPQRDCTLEDFDSFD